MADDFNKELLPDKTWEELSAINQEAKICKFLHGGALETSKMLHGRAEKVKKNKFDVAESSNTKSNYPGGLFNERGYYDWFYGQTKVGF